MLHTNVICLAVQLLASCCCLNAVAIPSDHASTTPQITDTCLEPECFLAAEEILKKIDESVDPCDDFYQFACGGFINSTVIPDSEKQVSQFRLTADKLEENLKLLVQEPITTNDPLVAKLVKTLYNSCMNVEKLEELDVGPLMDMINKLGGWPVLSTVWDERNFSVFDMNSKFNQIGLPFSQLISVDVASSSKNSSTRIISLDQCSLSLGQKYLLKGLNDTTIKAYYMYMIDIVEALGANRIVAEEDMMDVLKFEIQLAKISIPDEQRRDMLSLYKTSTLKQLAQTHPMIPWMDCINSFTSPVHKIDDEERVEIFMAETFISNLTHLLETVPKKTLANYLSWRAAFSHIYLMPKRFREIQLTFEKVLRGTTAEKPRWKECIEMVSKRLDKATGALYVRRYFDEDAKTAAELMEKNIRREFENHLKYTNWMDDKTKERAKRKSQAIRPYIGYPKELLNDTLLTKVYEGLELDQHKLFENSLHLSYYERIHSVKKLRKPVDKYNWEIHSGSAEVNAYYNPLDNSIEFPAGILQGVFFGKLRPHYLNYGGIGMVIGHELIHGFDDMGRQYDQDGNLIPWWEGDTDKNFKSRAQCIIDQYGNYSIQNTNLKLNGINTQGENIADVGGVKWAYKGYLKWVDENKPEKKLPRLKYSPQQLFWMGFANTMCEKTRPEALQLKVLTDVHSPGRFRVIGAVSNNPSFAQDFHCSEESKMNRKNKCEVW